LRCGTRFPEPLGILTPAGLNQIKGYSLHLNLSVSSCLLSPDRQSRTIGGRLSHFCCCI